MANSIFIELHMIQNFASSNLNRGDTGTPKDTQFGGQRRARISSQCVKRAIRTHDFFPRYTQTDESKRTLWMLRLFGPPLRGLGKPEEEIMTVIQLFAPRFLGKGGKIDKEHKANMLLYLGSDEVAKISNILAENWDLFLQFAREEERIDAEMKAKKEAGQKADKRPANPHGKSLAKIITELIKEMKDFPSAPDIAMFGRMLAGQPSLNIIAACHVAPAISTHRIEMEMDYFTAVDDLQKPGEETGASMIGFKEFNSPCYYRYMRIDWDKLRENLREDVNLARQTVTAFIRSMIAAVPSGMQSGSAAYQPPSFLLAVIRRDGMNWTLTNAFEEPVTPYYHPQLEKQIGLRTASVIALDKLWGKLCEFYGDDGVTPIAVNVDNDYPLEKLAPTLKYNQEDWIQSILNELPEE